MILGKKMLGHLVSFTFRQQSRAAGGTWPRPATAVETLLCVSDLQCCAPEVREWGQIVS